MHVSSSVPLSHPAIPEEPALEAHNAAVELRIYFEHVLMDLRHYVDRDAVTLGESRAADIFLASDGLPSERFPLLRRAAGRQLLTFSSHMRGEVEIDGVVWPLNALVAAGLAQADPELPECYCLLLGVNTRVLIHWAGATLAMRFVARTRPPPRAGHTFDLHYLNTLCASVFLHVTLVVTLLLHPYDAKALEREKLIDAIIELAPRQMPVPLPRPAPPPKTPAKATPSEAPRARPSKNAPPRGLRMGPGINKDLLRQELRELLDGGSLLGGDLPALKDSVRLPGSMRAVPGLPIVGRDLVPGDFGGFGALRGGGNVDTLGRFGGERDYGAGSRFGGARKQVNLIKVGPTKVIDPIDRETIRKVVDGNRNQLRYCYERELQREHELAGRVFLHWVIGADGQVLSATVIESTLASPKAERCMTHMVERWRFPALHGGGRAEVNYPFVFHAD